MKNKIAVILSLVSISTFAQNLVINPGFEEHGEISGNAGDKDNLKGNHVLKWTSPTGGSPDYFLSGSEYLYNSYGYPKCKSGEAMVGIDAFDGKRNYREYVQGALELPLLADSSYTFTISLALAGVSKFSIDEFGVYFSTKQINEKKLIGVLEVEPQLILDSLNEAHLSKQWITFRLVYKASGGEQFFVIGNFNTNKNSETMELNNGHYEYAYYYIDDVSLIPGETQRSTPTELVVDQNEQEETSDTLNVRAGKIIILPILFDVDESVISSDYFGILDAIITQMKEQPDLHVEIDGHTDSDGLAPHNLQLSKDRANAVATYFKEHGINEERIRTNGFGGMKPISNDKFKNRRVEFIFSE